VSRLAERNVPVAFAAELVGHARVQTTVDVYTKISEGSTEDSTQLRASQAFRRGRGRSSSRPKLQASKPVREAILR
jgi:hypothetical protein